MVGPGEEAHTYEPKPEQMKALSDSQVFFSIGVEYEASWIPRFVDINPDLKIVNSAEGIQRIAVTESHSHEDEEEGHEEEVQAEGLDPHVWLAPDNGRIIAENILHSLLEIAPEHASEFQANYEALSADIDTLNDQITSALSGIEKRSFMVFHPAWGYFAEQYNLEQIPVQVGGQDPSASELADLINLAREENTRVIFIQPTFNAANAQAIAEEIGAEVAVVDPLARDWLANLESVADAFAAALSD
jgi:zinc transport system substrate-binding protein